MQYLQGQRLLILGLGVSGLSMARWCARCGAIVRIADTRENPPGLDALHELVPELDFVSGAFDAQQLFWADDGIEVKRVLRSPGLSPHDEGVKAVLCAAQKQGILIQGELDLFTEALVYVDQYRLQEDQARLDVQVQNEQEEMACPVADSHALLDLHETTNTDSHDFSEDDINVGVHQGLDAQENPAPVVLPTPQGYKPTILAITGTNGKTTVTALTAKLVERAGKSAAAAGNIGTAMLDMLAMKLDEQNLPDVWVLELSSFQLDSAVSFDPSAATILNISQDHLDWHGSMTEYVTAKSHVLGKSTVCILNRNDQTVMQFAPQITIEVKHESKRKGRTNKVQNTPSRLLTFGCDAPKKAGDWGIVQDGGIPWLAQAQVAHETVMDMQALSMQLLMPVDALRIRGRHNATNALAALALASQAGCDMAPMLFGLREYRGEAHRVESIGMIDGVEYFDDSKGTNVGATAAALAGLGVDQKIVLILGGDGKGQDFSPLVPLVAQYVRAVLLIGRDASVIEQALDKTDVLCIHASSMDNAVNLAAQQAQKGDAVLLSPACASLDMFKNYVERAQVFINAVHALAQDRGHVMIGGWQ